jgi:hypothetical protein
LISHRSNLIAIARRNGVRGASADEVADEAVLSALEAFKDRPQHLEKPHAWLIKILSRKIVDFKRRQKKRPSFSDIGREFGETLIDGLAQAGSEEMTEDKWILQNLPEGLARNAEDFATGHEAKVNVCGRTRQRLREWRTKYEGGPAEAQQAFKELFTYPNGEFHTLGRDWEWLAPSETLAEYYKKECFGMPKEFVRLHHGFGVFFISYFERLAELGRAPRGILTTRANKLLRSCSEASRAYSFHALENWGVELREDEDGRGLKWLQEEWGCDTACAGFSGTPDYRRLLFVAIRETSSLYIKVLKPGKAAWKLAAPVVAFSSSGVQSDWRSREC